MCDYNYLMKMAKEASEMAYSKYSNFNVGACLLTATGKTFKGCNFENASYGLSICAERNAIGSAVLEGELKIKAIAIYSPNMNNCYPCGACRQVLDEFKDGDIDVITDNNGEIKITKLSYLLPENFSL